MRAKKTNSDEYQVRPSIQELEERERRAYEQIPEDVAEVAEWEAEISWPEP